MVWTAHLLTRCRRQLGAFARVRRKWRSPRPDKSLSSGSSLSRWSWECDWNDAWQGWDESAITEPAASEPVPDERITNALKRLQDHLQQTMVISQRRSQKAQTEQSASKAKGDAACAAMEAVSQARAWQD